MQKKEGRQDNFKGWQYLKSNTIIVSKLLNYGKLMNEKSNKQLLEEIDKLRKEIHNLKKEDKKNKNILENNQEKKLQESELLFSSLLEHSPIYVFFKDNNIRSIRLSKNYEDMLGMPVKEALGKSMYDLFPTELAQSMVEDDKKILEKGEIIKVVEEHAGRIYETTKFPIFIDGIPKMLAEFAIDITAKIINREHNGCSFLL